MSTILDRLDSVPKNRPVIDYLKGASAHSDLSEFFRLQTHTLPEVTLYSPPEPVFGYCLAHANDIVFGFCTGMQFVSLLVPKTLHEMAVKDQGRAHDHLSEIGWFDFPVFNSNERPDHSWWIECAYHHATKQFDFDGMIK